MFQTLGRNRAIQRIQKRHQDGVFSPLEEHIARELADRILDTKKPFSHIAIVSATATPLTQMVKNLCPDAQVGTHILSTSEGHITEPTLEEGCYDLILSTMYLHMIDDVPAHILKLGKALIPDGLFMANMIGEDTFYEWKEAAKKVNDKAGLTGPFADIKDMGSILQTFKFALPVVDKDTFVMTYPTFSDMYQDMRAHGVVNLHPQRGQSLGHVKRLQSLQYTYQELFQTQDGKLPLSVQVLTLSGWFPHVSQQQPLAPGSATIQLDEALKKKL